MTNSTSSVRAAVNPSVIRMDELTVEEREIIRQRREQEDAKKEAYALFLQLKVLEEQMGVTVTTKPCDSKLIKDPVLKAAREKEEYEQKIDSLRREVESVRRVGEQRAVVYSLMSFAGGVLYGAFFGRIEGAETAIKAAGPLGKLLRRRMEK